MSSLHSPKLSSPVSIESLTDFLDRHRRAVIAALSVVIAIALVSMAWFFLAHFFAPAPPPRMAMTFFYDQNSGELFEAPAAVEGPLETTTGPYRGMPAGVRATVFSCGSCADESQRFVGWLEVPSAAVTASGQSLPFRPRPPLVAGDEEVIIKDGLLAIRAPDDERWQYFDSTAGQRIIDSALKRCNGDQKARHCQPPRRLASDVEPALLEAAQRALTGEERESQ